MEENQIEPKVEPTKEEIVQERGNKLIEFLKKPTIWVVGCLILLMILGIYIRVQPMNINPNTGKPGLWDITTDTWTLGPDLDPWLFTRYAETIVETGSLPEVDMMRNVPLGFASSGDTILLPYMIVWTHKVVSIFGDYPVVFSAALFPVIMFALTIIAFFLFVREIFIRKSKKSKLRANIIGLISTLFLTVIPVLLPRTIAGIPEKESAAFFFLFLAFYFFLKAWKSEKIKNAVILAILAGISTAALGAIWGGILYVFITIGGASLIAFILNKIHKKEFIIYSLWVLTSYSLLILFTTRLPLKETILSLDTGFVSLIFFIFIVHFILWNTKIKNILYIKKIPKNIISLCIAIIFGIILISILFGPRITIEKIKLINNVLFTPTTGRWNITVAENRQPYFAGWARHFGPYIKNIPLMFWLFFAGSIVLFKKMFNKIKKKDSWILTGLYILFFFGLVFSRYSSSSMFNGTNFISKSFYLGSTLLLISSLIYYYLKYYKEENKAFEMINFEYILLFTLFFLCLITARSAIRLIMVLAPIASIFVGSLIMDSISRFIKTKEETWKIIFGVIIIVLIIASAFTILAFYKEAKGTARGYIPSHYSQQWYKAMQWVREETPENAVFGHWWDYGYWVQSIGNRATITDGGNAISFWNYWTGRLVLTGDNQKDALDFLYTHDADYLLIDSSDIGKYTAFSSIGSDENYDRYSWFGTFFIDEKQIQETKNETIYNYVGGVGLDEDIIIEENGKKTLLPAQVTGVLGISLSITTGGNLKQPIVILVYQGKQHRIPMRYLYMEGELIDFGTGIEATAYIFPQLIQDQGIRQNPIGAAMFISPRLMRGMFSQIYLLENSLGNFDSFELIHNEPNFIINDLRGQGLDLPDFIYLQGIQGPIKIWKINYTGEGKFKEEYLDRDASKYINWSL